ncbi:MAG TPA: penicillin-binding transpeptidase domain-containing protein [Planctomycetota bacterium]|nr:penicillin-binding transpeptidase domain-containing protein [Planctomycetota bacterium]
MQRDRVLLVATLLLLPLGGLEARLAWLQVLRPGAAGGALLNRSPDLAPAERGRILDREGRVLAQDTWSFDLHVVVEEFERRTQAPEELAKLLDRPVPEVAQAIEEIYRKIEKLMQRRPEREKPRIYARERRTPYPLFKAISREAAYAIETNPDRFPGCVVREGLRRIYPYGEVGAHVIGYLGPATALKNAPPREGEVPKPSRFDALLKQGYFSEGFEEWIDEDDVEFLARRGIFDQIMVPITGVEKTWDDKLRGHPGLVVLERDPATGNKNWVEQLKARPGEDVKLSVDAELMKDIAGILAEARGEDGESKVATAMVADPATGEILAMGSNASFDPNAFIPPTRKADLDRYLDDRGRKPLRNRCSQGQAEVALGSIFKIVSSVAALQEGHVRPSDTFVCNGKYRADLPSTNCWVWNRFKTMHGEVALASALEQSCNCYFYSLAERVPLGELSAWATRLGFGTRTGIDLPSEGDGNLPSPLTHPKWRIGDSYSLFIGQHELTVTPVQVLKMICAIANGGNAVTPHVGPGEFPARPLGIRPENLAAIREGLNAVVHGEHGTAHETELRNVDAAGKTGSATWNVAHHRAHAWFAGYAPADRPRYAIVVLVEDGGSGGHMAAPLAAKIVARLQRASEGR